MARFRGTVLGTRGSASRLGHDKSGLQVTAHGWHLGIRVEAKPDREDPQHDCFRVYVNGGSGETQKEKLIAVLVDGEGTNRFLEKE